jgi:flagellar FliL protein
LVKPATASEVPAANSAGSAKSTSIGTLLVAVTIVTGLSVGAGGMFGLQLASKLARPSPSAPAGQAKNAESVKGGYAKTATIYALPAIVTNLASPERTWIRLEASIVLDEESAEGKALAAAIAEDATAYLRTLSLPLIEGASGLLHLREDLNDRARVRSGGKVRDMLVHTLIVE